MEPARRGFRVSDHDSKDVLDSRKCSLSRLVALPLLTCCIDRPLLLELAWMTCLASNSRHSTIFVYRPPPLGIQQPLEIAATALHYRTTQPPKDRLQSCAIQITKGPGVDTSFPPQKSLSRPGHSTSNKPVYSSPRSYRHLVIPRDSDEDQDLADRLLTG